MTIITEDLSQDPPSPSNYRYIKNFSKRMLKTQLFIGNFHEKRFVESLACYRDVVRIDPDEDKFIENLVTVKRKVRELPSGSVPWIGITEPDTIGAPVGYNLWVELPVEIFGRYWFKVSTVEFLEKEIRLKLDIMKPLIRNNEQDRSGIGSEEFNLSAVLNGILNEVRVNLMNFCRDHITYKNTKQTLIFMFLLISTITVGGLKVVKYLMEYLVNFMRELSGLIRALTPVITTCMDIIKAIVLGTLEMIFSLLYDKRKTQATQYNAYINVDPNMIKFNDARETYGEHPTGRALPYGEIRDGYSQYPTRRALPYRRSRTTITPWN
ncbi:uncharacterized protein LOC132702091 [Cylas formicarius]|uniref:uncharacterized protein LOC132702091 n=1 Tax=Cylas formicarius TaxID=197179 RepID=UPI002958AC42|nr:uncharacterized protein LOC132702091 [Cylas formicarius]XP_060526497.1 uncharacterized protein LOC132702091 [Cylas formicarius]